MGDSEMTIGGTLRSVAGKAEVAGIEAWFAYTTVDGEEFNTTTHSDQDGSFVFDIPAQPLDRAVIGAHREGVEPVDLEPSGARLQPGDLVLMIDDIVPTHLRYAG